MEVFRRCFLVNTRKDVEAAEIGSSDVRRRDASRNVMGSGHCSTSINALDIRRFLFFFAQGGGEMRIKGTSKDPVKNFAGALLSPNSSLLFLTYCNLFPLGHINQGHQDLSPVEWLARGRLGSPKNHRSLLSWERHEGRNQQPRQWSERGGCNFSNSFMDSSMRNGVTLESCS